MDRCVFVTVGGTAYPMCLTLRATKELTKRFGGLERVSDALTGMAITDQLDAILWLLCLLIAEGCALSDMMGEAVYSPLPVEQLETMLTPSDLIAMKDDLFTCMALGMGREVPGKNRKTGQTATQDSLPG